MEQFIVSARKYRPKSFGTLLGQENIAKTLKNSIERGQLAHSYLFCGPRGVGKTSAARIFAKTINCSNPGPGLEPCGECESCRSFAEDRSYCIHELDAASNNSVDDIRNLVEEVRIPPQVGRYSVYIIDEVHMLTQSAFNAFLKTLEEPPAYAIFILATTEKHKILPTILSRCQTFDFNRISIEDIVRNLKDISAKEGVDISEDAMHVIAQKADGAMRDALTLFDQTVAFCGKKVTYAQVIKNLNVLDYDYYITITDYFLEGEYAKALMLFDEILSKGFNALHFLSGLSSHFRDLLVCKNQASETLIDLAPSIVVKYKDLAGKCSIPFLFEALSITSSYETLYRQSGNPRLLIEFALMKICNLSGKFATVQQTASQETAPISVAKAPAGDTPVSKEAPAAPSPRTVAASSAAPAQPALSASGPVRKSSGLSLKAMMQEVQDGPEAKPEEKIDAGERLPLNEENMAAVWKSLAESESKMPRLSSAIAAATPRLEGEKEIHFEVGNEAQREWIEKNCRVRMEAFLQRSFRNSDLRLFVEVAEVPETERKALYMPSDKARWLHENSAEFRGLQKDFELETN